MTKLDGDSFDLRSSGSRGAGSARHLTIRRLVRVENSFRVEGSLWRRGPCSMTSSSPGPPSQELNRLSPFYHSLPRLQPFNYPQLTSLPTTSEPLGPSTKLDASLTPTSQWIPSSTRLENRALGLAPANHPVPSAGQGVRDLGGGTDVRQGAVQQVQCVHSSASFLPTRVC